MSPLDSLRGALWSLWASKLRTFLTLLGVVIGVGAVISVMSIGRGSREAVTQQIESIGSNLIFVRPQAIRDQNVRGQLGSGLTLSLSDAEALADAPNVAGVAPEVNSFAQVQAGGNNTATRVLGVTPSYEQVRNFSVADGRFITDTDVDARSLNAVLGSRVATTLFPDSDPLGQTIQLNRRPYRVVGVLKTVGGGGQGVQDDAVLLPITTVQTRLVNQRQAGGANPVQLITVQATGEKTMDAAKEAITALLRERHRITGVDDFVLTSQDDLIAARTEVTNVLTILLGSIAGISLVVGGIGIMNIMLVSVTERTREIGIRKAVGAKRRDILSQFLTEAMMLSIAGGGIGLGAGFGVARLLEKLTLSGQAVQTLVTWDVAVLAVGVAVAIGLFFGIYPAMRAARMDPIEALRHQ
ncbi:MAG: FtsX-like permease family protein [Dehalococcoidia bacterium]|nr:FtsX-like permease family protein [Dehalococcoidia bacterium]